jgi:hypothetical protein
MQGLAGARHVCHWGSLGDIMRLFRRQPSFDFSKFKETWHQQNVGGIEAVQL